MKSLHFAFLGMLFWGIAPLFGKIGLIQVSPGIALTLRSIVISGILITWLTASGQMGSLAHVTARDWFFIGMEGIFASLLGHLAYYYALKTGEISRVSPVMAGFPIVALFIAVIFLGESLNLFKIGGAILIVLGVILLKM